MFLPTNRPTRRQFLGRSALGAGSALFLPGLLTSCTDHIVVPTGPGTPIVPPLLGDSNIDWSDDAKSVVKTMISMTVPEGGELLSLLVDVFWPDGKPSIWDQVKDQTAALINQSISNDDFSQREDDLEGFKGPLDLLKKAIADNAISDIQTYWDNLNLLFESKIPVFKDENGTHDVLFLPLFAQLANMHLALLRDGVLNGASWGLDVSAASITLTNSITDYTAWVNATYTKGLSNLTTANKPDNSLNEPFKTTNAYTRQMTLWVLDFMDTWPYYDVDQHSNGATVEYTREIYSDPFGNTFTGDNTETPIALPQPATQRPTGLTVWSGSRIDAVQLTYSNGGAPGGGNQTTRMGDQKGGSANYFNIALDNPIIQAYVSYESADYYVGSRYVSQTAVDSMYFLFNDGSTTPQMGKKKTDQSSHDSGTIGYNYMALSSIYIHGVSSVYKDGGDCIIFGFLYWQSPAATLSVIRSLYVTSPKEHSMADLSKAFPKLSLSAGLISEDLKGMRKAYWERFSARVHK